MQQIKIEFISYSCYLSVLGQLEFRGSHLLNETSSNVNMHIDKIQLLCLHYLLRDRHILITIMSLHEK
jgi:hypothetical protein